MLEENTRYHLVSAEWLAHEAQGPGIRAVGSTEWVEVSGHHLRRGRVELLGDWLTVSYEMRGPSPDGELAGHAILIAPGQPEEKLRATEAYGGVREDGLHFWVQRYEWPGGPSKLTVRYVSDDRVILAEEHLVLA